MTNAESADQHSQIAGDRSSITRASVLKVFVAIAAVTFILRIAYSGHLYEDDGLWFTAAEELLRGKALYRQIYFDKPPCLPLTYALLFWIFGAHILTIRLFTMVYSIAISAVLYLFGKRLYGKRIGLLAAAMFAVFSTTYAIGQIQSLSTDCLMALPYTAGAYLLVRSRDCVGRLQRKRWSDALCAFAGGALAGVAFQTNPKGVFDLVFYGLLLILGPWWATARLSARSGGKTSSHRAGQSEALNEAELNPTASVRPLASPLLFLTAAAGFAIGALMFIGYIAATHSLADYRQFVWHWGARYAGYHPASAVAAAALKYTAGYLALNDILLITLIFVVVVTAKEILKRRATGTHRDRESGRSFDQRETRHGESESVFESDATVLMWLAVSYAGVTVGGRFYSHYFYQILPALCLIGARGLTGILSALKSRSVVLRRMIIAMLFVGFAFTLVRFHGRGLLLAIEWAQGKTSTLNAEWYHEIRKREERATAALVRDLEEPEEAAERVSLEGIRADGPRTRPADGPSDYLFVWGYRPELYFWSGLLPASRYLSTQPLTGVPADVHYINGETRSILEESSTATARIQLVQDLKETRPKYIVDELGFFNEGLAILRYDELRELMSDYKAIGTSGRFLIYIRADLTRKYIKRNSKQP